MHKHPHPPRVLVCWEKDQLLQAVEAGLSKRKLTREELVDLVLRDLASRYSRTIIERFVDDYLTEKEGVRSEIRYYLQR